MAKRSFLLAVLTLAFGFARALAATTQSDAGIKREVLNLENQRSQALQKGDIATLDRIFGNSYVYVNVFGEFYSKAERLATIRSGASKHLSLQEDDYRVHIYGSTIVMTGRATGIVHYKGVVNRKPREFTNIYVEQGGRWRLIFHQATPLTQQ